MQQPLGVDPGTLLWHFAPWTVTPNREPIILQKTCRNASYASAHYCNNLNDRCYWNKTHGPCDIIQASSIKERVKWKAGHFLCSYSSVGLIIRSLAQPVTDVLQVISSDLCSHQEYLVNIPPALMTLLPPFVTRSQQSQQRLREFACLSSSPAEFNQLQTLNSERCWKLGFLTLDRISCLHCCVTQLSTLCLPRKLLIHLLR